MRPIYSHFPEGSPMAAFFDDKDKFFLPERVVYPKSDGCVEEEHLKKLFGTIERNIERMTKHRMQAGYKRHVDGRSNLLVGCLQPNQWRIFKKELKTNRTPQPTRKRSFNVPSFDDERVKERYEKIRWERHLPIFRHNSAWWVNKWPDAMLNIWRAWLVNLTIIYNSYTCAVTISFDYMVQFYNETNCVWQSI